jgi:FkbM family methyltransferase
VGANAGFYAIAAAVSNPMLKVFAFEPNSAVRNKLTLNVDLNGVGSRVSISPYGMSNSKSTANIFVPRVTGSGGGSLINLHPDEEVDYTELIELSTLDEEVTENPDLLKIDVEGHELKVILGGLRSLEESLPTVFIELLLKWMAPFGDHPMDVMKVMATFGYSCWAMSDTFVRPITVIDESTVETNFVFAHPSRPSHISAIESLLS